MKTKSIRSRKEAFNNFRASDWQDPGELFRNFDAELNGFGLELVLGNFKDDNFWIRIVKRKKK